MYCSAYSAPFAPVLPSYNIGTPFGGTYGTLWDSYVGGSYNIYLDDYLVKY